MEKHFVTYNQALALKELEFDEPCLAYYEGTDLTHGMLNDIGKHRYLIAPLKSQVFEWFRKEHNLKGFVEPVEYLDDTPETYMWVVYNECHSGAKQLTFEEAESACIDKLIEIIKLK